MNNRFFKAAFKASLNSQYTHKLGAVLVKGGSIISSGFSKTRAIAFGQKFGYQEGSIHAEVDCLIGISKSVSSGCDLYVFRAYKKANSGIALAKPCPQCVAFCQSMLIKRIYFTDPDEEKGYGVIKL